MRIPRASVFSLRYTFWYVLAFTLLITIPAVVLVATQPAFSSWYAERFILPPLERDLGFRIGRMTLASDRGPWEVYGIVDVLPGGPMANAGVRAGDFPFKYEHGLAELIYGLEYGRGRTVEVRVIARDDFDARRWSSRRVLTVAVPSASSPN